MTFRVAHWDYTLNDILMFKYAREEIFEHTISNCQLSTFFVSKRKISLSHANGKCHLFILWSTCRPLCDIGMHLVKLLKILMPRY